MSLPLKATAASGSAVQELDAWFIGLGDDFIGRVPASSLRPRMVEGWRLRWRERELEIQVDADFPYSVARVYLVGYTCFDQAGIRIIGLTKARSKALMPALEARNRRMTNVVCPCDISQDLSRLSPSQSLPPLMR